MASLTDSWKIDEVEIPNRVLLAPLAGIGNWFVRLQAQRYGAGLCFSEMVSSFAIHYENERTCRELLRIHPDEQRVALQLFGHDPEVMFSAAKTVSGIGAQMIDINMGCPVPKVCKTGAGAALLQDPDRAVEIAIAAREGSGLPVSVKLRPGRRPGDRDGVEVARRLVADAGISALTFHPRHASQQHKGKPDYELARELIEELSVPVIVSGGLTSPEKAHEVFEFTGAAAVVLARGSLGNPWLFRQTLGIDTAEPSPEEVVEEFEWITLRAVEHIGEARASSYLRKFYPWYVDRLGGEASIQDALQRSESTDEARTIVRNAYLQQAVV